MATARGRAATARGRAAAAAGGKGGGRARACRGGSEVSTAGLPPAPGGNILRYLQDLEGGFV